MKKRSRYSNHKLKYKKTLTTNRNDIEHKR